MWQVEIGDFPVRVLQKHWAGVKRFSDITKCGRHNLEPVDIISGGFPCQQISFAGNREGIGTGETLPNGAGCGSSSAALSARCGPDGSSLRTFLASRISALTKSSPEWRRSATPAGRSWWVLAISGHRTSGKESGCSAAETTTLSPCSERAGTPECNREMSRAREVWDRLKRELAGPLSQHSPMAATPTHVMVVELDWPEDGRFFLLRNGRLRKTCKAGSKRGPNWQQELLYRSSSRKTKPAADPRAVRGLHGISTGLD